MLLASAGKPGCSNYTVLRLAGRPIAWFGRPVLAFAMYLPAALAGVLLPYALSSRPPHQAAGIHGSALANAALAALMSLFGLKSGFAFALWAMAGVAGLLCPKQVTAAVCIPKKLSVAPGLHHIMATAHST